MVSPSSMSETRFEAHTPPGSQQTPGPRHLYEAAWCNNMQSQQRRHACSITLTGRRIDTTICHRPQHRSCDQRSPHPDTHQGTDSTCNHADSSMNRSDATIQINNRTNQALHPQLPQQSTLATKPYAPTCSRQMQPSSHSSAGRRNNHSHRL